MANTKGELFPSDYTISWSEGVGWSEISDKTISRWQQIYPDVDIDGELARINEWLIANPRKRYKDWPRFIINWLKREHDKAKKQGKSKRVDAVSASGPTSHEWTRVLELLDALWPRATWNGPILDLIKEELNSADAELLLRSIKELKKKHTWVQPEPVEIISSYWTLVENEKRSKSESLVKKTNAELKQIEKEANERRVELLEYPDRDHVLAIRDGFRGAWPLRSECNRSDDPGEWSDLFIALVLNRLTKDGDDEDDD